MQYICTGKLHNTFGHSLCVPAQRSKPQASYFFQPDNRNHSSSLHFLAFRALLTVLFLVRKYHWETCYHAELLIVIFFICRNISQYVVFEKVNEKLQLLVEKLHSP